MLKNENFNSCSQTHTQISCNGNIYEAHNEALAQGDLIGKCLDLSIVDMGPDRRLGSS